MSIRFCVLSQSLHLCLCLYGFLSLVICTIALAGGHTHTHVCEYTNSDFTYLSMCDKYNCLYNFLFKISKNIDTICVPSTIILQCHLFIFTFSFRAFYILSTIPNRDRNDGIPGTLFLLVQNSHTR